MKTALTLIAFAVAGAGLVHTAISGRIVNRRWTLFDRRDDAPMFWIVWLFAAAIFGWFIYAGV